MIIGSSPIPAAQYVRMSTEHQQYSLDNQSTAIQRYAESHGFSVVRTYSDAARSGLVLKNRSGLRQLLKDVVAGATEFKVVLVYDISRWGRFQDTDESAHYEFLCKSAGVPVHYCAETFANDGSLTSFIMKSLKRTMAGEYSRELGVKVLAGQKRLACLGFKQGGSPGFGLRRMLLSSERVPKQELVTGERKSITTDRVILVPGPLHEVHWVQEIYRMFISEKQSVHAIAQELNRKGITNARNVEWNYGSVYTVLTHPKYMGCHVFGRTSSRLRTPNVKMARSEWVQTPKAFQPIVDEVTFSEAQRILQNRTINKSDEQLLNSLRALLASEGRLTLRLIKGSPDVPSPTTYRLRFGSLRRAYELIGYGRSPQFGSIDLRRRTQALREELIGQIAAMFPGEVSIVRRGGRWRSRLSLRNGSMVSVLVARFVRLQGGAVRWRIAPVLHESEFVTLLARLEEGNRQFLDFRVFPCMDRSGRFDVSMEDSWMNRGKPLGDLSSFSELVASFGPNPNALGGTPDDSSMRGLSPFSNPNTR